MPEGKIDDGYDLAAAVENRRFQTAPRPVLNIETARELVWDPRFLKAEDGGVIYGVHYVFAPEVMAEVVTWPVWHWDRATFAREYMKRRRNPWYKRLIAMVKDE